MSLNQSTPPKKRKPKVARDRLVLFAGKLFIFTRREYAKPTWHCEIRLPNQPVSIRSTGTTDEEKAKEIAHEWYQEAKFAVAQGKDIHSKRASVLLQNYIDFVESDEPNNQTRYIKLTYFKRWVSMLGAVQVGQIDAAFVTNLFRQTEMNSKKGSYSPNTHVKMSKYIKAFFKWCKSRGYLKTVPEMDQVKPRKSRRPHFDEDAYQRLLQSMPAFKINPNKRVARRRRMLCDYVQILANSGLRPGEHRKLKWDNIRYEMSHVTPHVILYVEGKTGRRPVVADACVEIWLKDLMDIHREVMGRDPSPNDYIFAGADGKPIHSFKKGLNTLLAFAGVTFDPYASKRSAYSLRHTYATNALINGINEFSLAQNMGTSVAMIEKHYSHVNTPDVVEELVKARALYASNGNSVTMS